MENISPETVQNFCRACLNELKQRQKYKIHSLNLQIRRWLEDTAINNPLAKDAYPHSICHLCRNKLNEFLQFYKMCTKSRKRIHKMLSNYEILQPSDKAGSDKIEINENVLKFNISPCYENKEINVTTGLEDNEMQINKPLRIDNNSFHRNKLNKLSILQKNNDQSEDDENCDIDMLKQQGNDSSEYNLADSEGLNTDSESENHNSGRSPNLKDETNSKHATENVSNISKAKAKRRKYTYSFHCDQCKYRCISQQTLDIHLRTHYGLKPFQCPKCENSFDKYIILLKHLNEVHHEKELNIICELEECGQKFTSIRSYKEHYRQNHIPQQILQNQGKSVVKSPYRHVCEECGKIYTKLQTFREHQYTHGPKDLYPFQCDECNKAFVKQRTFNEHKLRHAGIKNFECPSCGAKKTTKKELRSHMNSHTRERQYPCPNCPMIFYRSSNRRIHVDVVHQGIRRFACRYCDQMFGKGDNLKNHELLHTGEKPHACTECDKRFVQKVSLRSHMKTHNK